jgi:hypothetical protein
MFSMFSSENKEAEGFESTKIPSGLLVPIDATGIWSHPWMFLENRSVRSSKARGRPTVVGEMVEYSRMFCFLNGS